MQALIQQSTKLQQRPPTTSEPYDSNPFTLSFNALGRLFDSNAGWAITLLALALIGGGVQFANGLIGSLASDEKTAGTPTGTVTTADQASSLNPEQLLGILAIALIITILISVFLFVSFILQTFIGSMFAYVALQSEKGKKVTLGEAFGAVQKRFWRLLLAQGFANIKVFLWTLLFIIPGVIAALRYTLLLYVIMDEPETTKGVVAAHTRVKSIVKGRLIEVFSLLFAANLIPIVSGLLQLSGGAAQYRQLSSTPETARPKVHWINYLLPIVLGILLILFIAIIALVIAVASVGSR